MASPGQHAGPAWTRSTTKPRLRPSPSSSPAPAPTPAPGADPPQYLTHVHRHHGQITLVAPDNLGQRRQPGTVDPPARAVNAGGGWGVPTERAPAMDERELDRDDAAKLRKMRKRQGRREREERMRRERAIASAVVNAGRTPSPSRQLRLGDSQAATTGAAPPMARTRSGNSLEVPSATGPPRRRKSRERPSTAAATVSQSARPPASGE